MDFGGCVIESDQDHNRRATDAGDGDTDGNDDGDNQVQDLPQRDWL
jgi:hypothetical protein